MRAVTLKLLVQLQYKEIEGGKYIIVRKYPSDLNTPN